METVRAHGGQVWTLDGRLSADLLDPRPWQVPDLLLQAEEYAADARAYRDAAHQRALWAAWVLALERAPMDLARLRRLLDRETLLQALEPHRDRDPRIGDWLQRLQHQRGGIEDSGARGLNRSLGVLLDGVAMRGSLRACPEADPACKDPSRAYWLPSHRAGAPHEALHHAGALLDASTLPELPREPVRTELHRSPSATTLRNATQRDRQRAAAYMGRVIASLEQALPGERKPALNAAAWTLGRWVAAGALEQADVEDALYAAAERNGVVTDDGQRQTWATIRSGLGAGLHEPIDLGAKQACALNSSRRLSRYS